MRSHQRLTVLLATLAIVSLWGAGASAQTPTADAQLSTISPGDYAITLNNTGTTTVGTFWYAWTPGVDFMPGPIPGDITSPAGWTSTVTGSGNSSDGYAIQWRALTAAADSNPGNSLSGFSFMSTLTASQLTTDPSPFSTNPPVGTSVAYTGAPFSSSADTFVVTPVPEPSTLVLAALGAGAWLMGWRRRRLARSIQ